MANPLYRAERCRDLAEECRAIAALCGPSTEMQNHYSQMSEHYRLLAEAAELPKLSHFHRSDLTDGVRAQAPYR
jgi:DICT domain-containing protein